MHTQIMVKVNALVDEGVKPLVLALNQFPNILTLDSCEKGTDGRAHVAFTLPQGDPLEQAAFLQNLSRRIGSKCDGLPFSLSLEWFGGGEEALAWIRIDPTQAKALAAALDSLSRSQA